MNDETATRPAAGPRRPHGPRQVALRPYVQPYRSPEAVAAARSRAGEPVRTFHPRQGRVGGRHLDALARLMPVHGRTVAQLPPGPLRPVDLFGRPLPMVLEIGCPNILLPFAREAINDLVGKGGFPQLLINPVNFDALFQQKQASSQTNH